jgi:hypothetical protein
VGRLSDHAGRRLFVVAMALVALLLVWGITITWKG